MARLGFVGLGVMGGGVTKRLLAAGHEVAGYNRTREKAQPLVGQGLDLKDTPREVAEFADVVFSMVTNTKALRAITEGPDGILAGLAPGKIYVDMTTGTPADSRALAERVDELGAKMLDAPVSGSVSTLEEGRVSIMVGGDPEAFEQVEPILRDVGPIVKRIGDNGQALLMKIAINLSLHVQMVAFSEGLLLAEKDGIDREIAVEAMLNSVIASPMLKYRGPFVLEQPEEAWFDVDMMQKDIRLAREAADDLQIPLPSATVADEVLTTARRLGYTHRDLASLHQVLAEQRA